ncbi:MAG TPA: flagellar export chaperone FliS [Hypericibacter adhaerens]|jgi:flagellar protein FliS|uniref:flagellar export chaperone FliS n=1 Tax=Hypericibacter adhaerens TaxID=2602016 RepID=UPI002B6720BA|nr:flagellar export chaperone FliS [Hypericibacter adhaerens]HWA44895.1 flagellar export chaperone FliS [Hypericibacter adhaerens]
MTIIRHCDVDALIEAEPARRIVMLYDEAIAAIRIAGMAAASGDIEGRCNAVTAAMEIVGFLYVTLDTDLGGEVAVNLGSIYAHIMAQLPRVNVYNDTDTAERLVAMLEPLRDSWNELAGLTGLVSMSNAELRAAV